MLKIICAGLPRTGNTSLAEALRILGYETLQHTPERLPLLPTAETSFRVFDDVDAVVDLPAAMYWQELIEAYPEAKLILTTRDEWSWYKSMVRHSDHIRKTGSRKNVEYMDRLHALVFGTAGPSEYWYKRRFHDHEWAIRFWAEIQAEKEVWVQSKRLLIFDITTDCTHDTPERDSFAAWMTLSGFLDKDVPDVPFPWLNKGEVGDATR